MNTADDEQAPLTFRRADTADADRIVDLVNSAYRGESSRQGWTTEADLLDGQRTDRTEVLGLIEAENSLILLGFRGTDLIGCVHLEKVGGSAYFGMFAIKPELQGQGIGKRVMRTAEDFARREWGVGKMLMTVITLRPELIAFYERRGYRRTGELRPFPELSQLGSPRVAGLQLEVLEKTLTAAGATERESA